MHERVLEDPSNCSIARTLDVVGEKWTLLILREAFYGVTRFDDLHRILQCPRNLLAKRLRKLVAADILSEQSYREPGSRSRMEYLLTAKGRELLPAVIALLQWGDAYEADAEGPAVVITHEGCGGPVRLETRCSNENVAVPFDALEATRGPSFRLLPTADAR